MNNSTMHGINVTTDKMADGRTFGRPYENSGLEIRSNDCEGRRVGGKGMIQTALHFMH